MEKKLKFIAAALAAAVLAGGLAGCGGETKKEEKAAAKTETAPAIKIGIPPSLCQAPLVLAEAKGFYKEAGVDVEIVHIDSPSANEAIGSGKIDAMQTLITKTIKPWQNGLPVKAVVGTHSGCVRVDVRGDGEITDVKGLKGKKIGVAGLADTGTLVVQRALKKAGISSTPDNMEVEFVVVERNSLPQALESKQVDAIAMTDPVGAIAEKEYGFKAVVDTAVTDDFKDEYCCAIVIADRYLDAYPEQAKKFTEAVMKASLYVNEHPEEAAKILADSKYFAGEADFNAKLLATYNYKPSVTGGYEALAFSAQDLGELGLTEKTDGKTFADQHFKRLEGLPDTVTL